MNNVCFSWMLILWERIFGCQGYFVYGFVSQKTINQEDFLFCPPGLSSGEITLESDVIYRALWLSGRSWSTPETCPSWPLLSWWFSKSVGILFMRLQRPEVIRRKSTQNLVYEGVMITFTGPIEHIFRDQVTAFSKPSQPAVGGSDTQVSPTFTEASCLRSCK